MIAAAKNRRLDADGLLGLLAAAGESGEEEDLPLRLLRIGAELYSRYQLLVESHGGIDFNDMVRLAVDLVASHEDLAARLGARWPVVLEDEAQDSVPLQEELLGRLTAGSGHWIRVGDPNQSITSTFTSAEPRFLRRFLERPEVRTVEMSVSGRCSPRIMALANGLVAWTCGEYPVPEVREAAFRPQRIDPSGPGDPQPNPDDGDSAVALRPFDKREAELEYVARRALGFTRARPECTLAVLVPTNRLGFDMAEVLRRMEVSFDERLTTTRRSRAVIDRLARVLIFVANPLSPAALEGVFRVTSDEEQAEDLRPLVRSCYRPESLLYPAPGVSLADAFPPVARLQGDLGPLGELARRARRWLEAGRYPVDQLALAVAGELFEGDDLARAQRVAGHLRRRADQHPGWRLPELAADLQRPEAAREILAAEDEASYEPRPGQLTLTTMHKSKGMEWDLVYLVGVDGIEFPGAPEDYFRGHEPHLGGNPAEMAGARLTGLLEAGPRRSLERAGPAGVHRRAAAAALRRHHPGAALPLPQLQPHDPERTAHPHGPGVAALPPPGGPPRRRTGRDAMNLPPLSQSALSAFARCQRRFYLRYVRRLEWPAPLTGSEQEWERSLRRGERFHLLAQQHALGLPADEIARASGDEELTAWWARFRDHPPPAPEGPGVRVHTELELEVTLTSGRRLLARFDRLVVSGGPDGGRLDIFDWKTGSPSPREHLERSWQTRVYRFVALEGSASLAPGPVAPEGVRFVYWQSAQPEAPVALTYDREQHEEARRSIEEAAAEIEGRLEAGEAAFPRTDDIGRCRRCPYRTYCDRGREAEEGPDFEVEEEEGEADGWLAPPGDPEPG